MFASWRRTPSRRVPPALRLPMRLEALEDRLAPAVGLSYVNDDWVLVQDNGDGTLSAGDIVRNDLDSINPSTITATYGVDAFGTVTRSAVGTITGVPGSLPSFDSINDAIANTNAGGTVNVLEGTYSDTTAVNVNKSLTLLGAQAGVNGAADSRSGDAESIISAGADGAAISVTADSVTIDGFTVIHGFDFTNNDFFSGEGISVGAVTGTNILNNIISNNTLGVSAGGTNTVISGNLIAGNNLPGASSGNGVYRDDPTDGLVISDNTFNNNNNGSITLVTTAVAAVQTHQDLTISGNVSTDIAFALLADVSGGTITGNTVTATGDFSNIALAGGVTDLSITFNTLREGFRAIRIGTSTTLGVGVTTANSNLLINCNSFYGHSTGVALRVDAGAITDTLNAERNFWASPTGPQDASNPGGIGESIDNQSAQAVDFSPWATNPECTAFATANTDLSVTKAITDQDSSGRQLTYTIVAENLGGNADDGVVVTDTLPDGAVLLSSNPSQGTVSQSGNTITWDVGPLAAGATATLELDVRVSGPERSITNTATVTGTSTGDTDPTNNTATTTSDVTGPDQPEPRLAVGTVGGTTAQVVVYNPLTGAQLFTLTPYVGYQGGVRVATGDINGDGVEDILTVTTSGPAHVKAFDGRTGAEIRSFLVFEGFLGGLYVASGDLDGDSFDDIVVSTGAGGQGHVQAYSGANQAPLASFLAYPGFNGAVAVAVADVNGDSRDDIITLAVGVGHIKASSGVDNSLLLSFIAPSAATAASLAAGDGSGDSQAELFLGGNGIVTVLDPRTQQVLRTLEAFVGYLGRLDVAAVDIDGDALADLAAATAQNHGVVRVFDDAFVPRGDLYPFGLGFDLGVTVG